MLRVLVVAFSERANAVWAAEFVSSVQYFLLNLAGSRNELRLELLNRRFLDVYSGLEDLLHQIDPYSRAKPADDSVFNFQLECQLWSLPPAARSVIVKSSLGRDNCAGLSNRLRETKAVESVTLPGDVWEKAEPRYVKHPFAAQFTASLPAPKAPSSPIPRKAVQRTDASVATGSTSATISANSSTAAKKTGEKKPRETIDLATLGKCRLAIMVRGTQEKVLVAFQDQKIRNMKVVGQVGLELATNASFASGLHALVDMNPLWSDPKKVEKRPCSSFIEQVSPVTYDVSLSEITKSSALLEYIVSPLTINLSRFPLLAHYTASPVHANTFRLEVHYKANPEWPQALSDLSISVTLTDDRAAIAEQAEGMSVANGVIEWKTARLSPGEKGTLECSVTVTTYSRHATTGAGLAPMDHVKVAFRCTDCNISDIDGAVKTREKDVAAVRRLMVELVISPNS